MNKINNKNFEDISPTAIVTSYPRTFTDIPYEKEIYSWLEKNCSSNVALYKDLAPEIEARYKLINKLLDKYKIKQVLELAAGYSSCGLIYSKNGYKYVELDLKDVSKNKERIIKNITNEFPANLKLISGNALKSNDFDKCSSYLEKNQPVAVINEGLLRYLTFAEKKIVGENIHKLLSVHNGIWITSDLTPKKFISSQNEALTDFNSKVANITSRNNLNDRFENLEHVKKFYGNIGFEVIEVHKFSEVKDELYSVNTLNIINNKIEKTLDDAIVVVMKVNKHQYK